VITFPEFTSVHCGCHNRMCCMRVEHRHLCRHKLSEVELHVWRQRQLDHEQQRMLRVGRTKLGQLGERIRLGRHVEHILLVQLGEHIQLGRHGEHILLGQHGQLKLGQHGLLRLGRHGQRLLEQHEQRQLGQHGHGQLGRSWKRLR